jgi:hypothetical protein
MPTFSGDFILDDRTLVRDNPYLTRPQPLLSYLSQEDGITDERDKGAFSTGYYRPLMNVPITSIIGCGGNERRVSTQMGFSISLTAFYSTS